MSFRQFPAIDANGESHVIIEFTPDSTEPSGEAAAPRYELQDGRVLVREGRRFNAPDGSIRLTLP